MKKLLCILALLCFALVLTGCGCKHEETTVINAADATCTEDGYTGDTQCVKCSEIITKGATLLATGHTESDLAGFREPTCTREGYTGDIQCLTCGEYIVKGEATPKVEHQRTEPSNAREPECMRDGYTGDIYCAVCYTLCEEGEYIPAFGHTMGDPENAVEATCLEGGFTGNRRCVTCDDFFHGEDIPRLEHVYEDGYCTACGWRLPGLYINGKMEFTWDELVETNYIAVSVTEYYTDVESVVPSLYGELVVSDAVRTCYDSAFENSQLTKVWIPSGCSLNTRTFRNAAALEEIIFFGSREDIGSECFLGCTALSKVDLGEWIHYISSRAFEGCTNLESIVLPEGLLYVDNDVFKGCEKLAEVNIPSTVLQIESNAFNGCTALTSIELNEGLEEIGRNAFSGTAITKLVIPSTVTEVDDFECETLVSVDLSKTSFERLPNSTLFENCTALEEIIFPSTLKLLSTKALNNCSALKQLILPDGLTTFEGTSDYLENCTSLNTIVWPVTLTDGTALQGLPALKNILYRGSEMQWSMTTSKDLFPNATIIYGYEG